MYKKILTLMITAGLTISALTACEKTSETEENITTEAAESETFEELLDEIQDDLEEFDNSHYYSLEAYGLDDALLIITSTDEEGQTIVEETGSWGGFGNAGMTIGDLMADWNVTSVEATCTGGDFCGWTAVENIVEVDENDFAEVTQETLYDGKVFTTDEMMSLELPDGDVVFYAAWEFDCSGCKEHKVCNAYYIDNDCYLVCDDCYEEFAYGMGLIEE